jgi:putative glutamine amidotransferase
MTIEELYENERERLTGRLTRMVGSRAVAEDLSQEAFLRTWHRAPEDLDGDGRAAWLNRTATNLAIDELRRRRTSSVDLERLELAADDGDPTDILAAREGLAALSPHERMVLLLRFELGLGHAEIGALLDVSAEAARKRVDRARESFSAALRGSRQGRRPVILLEARRDFDLYKRWLENAGAEVRAPSRRAGDEAERERDLACADGVLIGGSFTDLHPALYREPRRAELNDPDLGEDLRELRVMKTALRLDLPIVGVCRGHQLLNVALGGSLFQDLAGDRATRQSHWAHIHGIDTAGGSFARSLLGRRTDVPSEHHQATRRLGRGLRVSAVSRDGVVESVELPRRALTLGLQWHPETEEAGEAGRRVAEALVEAASR